MAIKPNLNDPSVGNRIRLRRRTIGMTQAELAAAVGVSFQQMQKYEKGINAISSDRLRQICDVLSLPHDFFETTAGPMIGRADPEQSNVSSLLAQHEAIDQFVASSEGRRLIESFIKITDKQLRTRILDFIASVSTD